VTFAVPSLTAIQTVPMTLGDGRAPTSSLRICTGRSVYVEPVLAELWDEHEALWRRGAKPDRTHGSGRHHETRTADGPVDEPTRDDRRPVRSSECALDRDTSFGDLCLSIYWSRLSPFVTV
jgi:hypothetical protein